MTHLKFEPPHLKILALRTRRMFSICGFRMPPIPEPKSRRDDFILVFTGIERTSAQAQDVCPNGEIHVHSDHRFNSPQHDHWLISTSTLV